MKGFRSLENGSRVAFSLRTGQKGKEVSYSESFFFISVPFEAYHVTGEHDGDEITGSSVRPIGRKKDNLIRYRPFYSLILSREGSYLYFRCFKCGSYGNHVASKCRKVTTDAKVRVIRKLSLKVSAPIR